MWGAVGGVGSRPQAPPTWAPFPHSGSYLGISRLKFSSPQDIASDPAKPLPVLLYVARALLTNSEGAGRNEIKTLVS